MRNKNFWTISEIHVMRACQPIIVLYLEKGMSNVFYVNVAQKNDFLQDFITLFIFTEFKYKKKL